MSDLNALKEAIQSKVSQFIQEASIANDELTIEVAPSALLEVAKILKTDESFNFEMLMDISGVDYLHYGISEWSTKDSTGQGFERGVLPIKDVIPNSPWDKQRFCAVYHLLSITYNHRLRIKVFLDDVEPVVDSVVDIWSSANWYEREAFDLYGILFKGHPDLRRLLTDYGFIGHPFRKDFPLVGNVEVRYDAKKGRVVYEPVDITPRTLVPKVIRKTHEEQEG